MFQTILAFFGYVKVPKEAIQMSMVLEDDFKGLADVFRDNLKAKAWFSYRQESMKALTEFLRNGRLLQ